MWNKKKFVALFAMVMIALLSMNVFATSEGQITANADTYCNVPFSNGYTGFCIDASLEWACEGDQYTVASDTSVATNNKDQEDISQKLKLLFVLNFEKMFKPQNDGYVIDSFTASTAVGSAVWHFSDDRNVSVGAEFVETVNAYNGSEIPDNGHKITLNNGDEITFNFMVLEPTGESSSGKTPEQRQSFFAYEISVQKAGAHEHDFSGDWKSENGKHYKECKSDKCNEKDQEGNHEEELRNVVEAEEFKEGYTGDKYCKVCDELLEKGSVIPQTHECDFTGEWKSENGKHYKECKSDKCNEKDQEGNHEEELRNAVEAEEFKEGYTGDKYCKVCDELLEEGSVVPQTHECEFKDTLTQGETGHWYDCKSEQCQEKSGVADHTYSEEHSKDKTNHWFECECGAKSEETAHTFEDKKNETHHWEECECGQVQNKEEHTYSEEYSKDEENHWKECECGAKTEEGTHEGTVADCVTGSVCETCEKELEGANQENHTGNIEIRNQKDATETEEGYTGDTHCSDCGELLEEGTVIPVGHSHTFTLEKNDKGHFEECACGTKSELEEHEFVDNKCSVCGYTKTVETTPTETESSETPMGDKDYKVWVAVCAISIIAMIALDKKRRSLNK